MSDHKSLWAGAWSGMEPARRSYAALPRRLNHVFEASADSTPAAIALECDGYAISYRQLDERSNQLAHVLVGKGVGVALSVTIR